MPLPLTVSCFSKIQIGFTFLVPAHPGSPGKRAVKWYVCVCGCPSCCPTVKALKACTRLLFITDFHAGVVLLLRFAQFFVEPLFTASATEREVNAVNSENDKNLQNDTWRLNQLDKSTAKPGHPYTKFGTGKMSHHVESSPYSLCLFNLAF